MHVPLHHLLPARADRRPDDEVAVDEAYTGPLGRHDDRPWLGLCMVASIDGSTVVDGTSSGLSSPNDSAIMLRLRSLADVILVGAGTARGEGYGPPKKPGQRIAVVTRSVSVDPTSDLFTSGAGFVITTESSDASAVEAAGVDVVRAGDHEVDLRRALALLSTVCEASDFVQAEGGPTLNAALAIADLIDEINVATAPATVGGSGPRLFDGGADHTHPFDLAQLLVDDESFVFSRWSRRVSTSP